MKTKLPLAALALVLSTILYQPSTAFAQGSLTPPGAPAPTMKALDQIEARTAITNAASLVTISQPGSYYLTRNLTVSAGDGIVIITNNVTLDLNGFTIASTAASATGYGIKLNGGWSDITICNGHIRGGVTNNGSGVYSGGGFGYGIYYSGTAPVNARVSGLSVSGCQNHGIWLGTGDSTVVEACTVRTVGSYGIYASTIKGCSAVDCGDTALAGNAVSDCRGECSGSGNGLYGTTALNCYGVSSSGYGLYASSAQNCYGYSSSGNGLTASSTALNCYGYSSSNEGLFARTALNCYGSSSSGYGLFAYTAQNCYGSSSGSGTGLYAFYLASGCFGFSYSSTGLNAWLANGCAGSSTIGTDLTVTHNVNSFAY